MSLHHPLLGACGVRHAFGTRGTLPPPGLRHPRQVHGAAVVPERFCVGRVPPEADAVVSCERGVAVGVVTADCLPVLLASRDGRAVAAIHAGWRGLAAGVIRAGVDALRHAAPPSALVAAIGPHAGACCYEVDAPVLDALRHRFADVDGCAVRVSRPGHGWLDLGLLAERELVAAGLARSAVGRFARDCTICDARRFESYRRDGARAGRLVHWIAAAGRDAT